MSSTAESSHRPRRAMLRCSQASNGHCIEVFPRETYPARSPARQAFLSFAGDVDEHQQPLPMTVEVLRARTEKWPASRGRQTVLLPRWPDYRDAAHAAGGDI